MKIHLPLVTQLLTISIASCTLLATPALAVYKCEINGKLSYSDKPCAKGKESQLESTRAPSPKEQHAANQAYLRDKRTLNKLEKEKQRQAVIEEKAQLRAAKQAEKQKKYCNKLALQLRWAQEDVARASGKKTAVAREKALRAEEKYTQACDNSATAGVLR